MFNTVAHKVSHLAKNKKITIVVAIILIWIVGYFMYFRFFGALPQATVLLFTEINHPNASDNIVIFSPHEDDETLATGGYITAAKKNGAKVTIIFATDGNNRGKKQLRYEESKNATAILGISENDLIYYNLPDTQLNKYKNELSVSITNTLAQINPNIIILPSPHDEHSDHKQLGLSVIEATEKMSECAKYSYLIHFRAFPRPQAYKPNYFLLPPVRLIQTHTTWYKFTLNSDELDKKNEAVLQYRSQLKTPFLHSLMTAFIRQNELFAVENN